MNKPLIKICPLFPKGFKHYSCEYKGIFGQGDSPKVAYNQMVSRYNYFFNWHQQLSYA